MDSASATALTASDRRSRRRSARPRLRHRPGSSAVVDGARRPAGFVFAARGGSSKSGHAALARAAGSAATCRFAPWSSSTASYCSAARRSASSRSSTPQGSPRGSKDRSSRNRFAAVSGAPRMAAQRARRCSATKSGACSGSVASTRIAARRTASRVFSLFAAIAAS